VLRWLLFKEIKSNLSMDVIALVLVDRYAGRPSQLGYGDPNRAIGFDHDPIEYDAAGTRCLLCTPFAPAFRPLRRESEEYSFFSCGYGKQ